MSNENRQDLGRIQAKLPYGKQIPGEGILNRIIPFGERAVLRLRAVLANFDEARAQELHYDNPPPVYKSGQDMNAKVKSMSGAVIISVRHTQAPINWDVDINSDPTEYTYQLAACLYLQM